MKRAAALALALACASLSACDKPYDNGYAVDLIISGDSTLSQSALQAAGTLTFDVTGAETASMSFPLTSPFAKGDERIIYRPLATSGVLTFVVAALDSTGMPIGSATVEVTLDAGKTVTRDVKLTKGSGHVTTGKLLVDYTTFDFGTYTTGQMASAHTFTVTNDTTMPSGPLTTALSGASAASFTLVADGCNNMALPPGNSCTVSVQLDTTMVGMPSATLTVSAAPPGMATVDITGTIVAPGSLTITPAAGDYGSIAAGQPSTPLMFTVANPSGTASGALTVAVSGADATLFGTPSGCDGMVLAPGETCMISIGFAPPVSALGLKDATLVVNATPGGPAVAELRGNVIRPGAIGISPGLFDFGKGSIGAASAPQAFTVTNTGAQATGTLSTMTSGAVDQFTINDGCAGEVLAAGATCTISVAFAPTSAGTDSLVLQVTGAPGGTASATALGIGGDFVKLTVVKAGPVNGSVTGLGITCGADCTELVDRNTTVTLTEAPDALVRFGGWSGSGTACDNTKTSTCMLTMAADVTITSTFLVRPNNNFVFVTSTTVVPGMLGATALAAADTICMNAAQAGNLGGTTYKAYLATTATSALARLAGSSGWVRTDGLPFAASLADLTANKILYPPRLDENGVQVPNDPTNATGSNMTVTGVDRTGMLIPNSNCNDWTNTGMNYYPGWASGGSDVWCAVSPAFQFNCTAPARLVCFQTDFNAGVMVTPPVKFRRAFLTQMAYFPPVGGIGGADAFCNTEKTMFNVTTGGSGVFQAALAPTGALASSRFDIAAGTAPWARPDGILLATTAAGAFADVLLAAPNVTAMNIYMDNRDVNDSAFIFMGGSAGVTTVGVDADNCTNWSNTGNGARAFGGRPDFADRAWSSGDATVSCAQSGGGNLSRFLCLEK